MRSGVELSDGMLRYLALIVRCLAEAAELLVLDDRETSLHPRVLEPFARQTVESGESFAMIVSQAAWHAIARTCAVVRIELASWTG